MNNYEDEDSVEIDSVISGEKEKECERYSIQTESQKQLTPFTNASNIFQADSLPQDLSESNLSNNHQNGQSLHMSQIEGKAGESGITAQIEEFQKNTAICKYFFRIYLNFYSEKYGRI